MVRRILRFVLGIALRLFFRRIEVVGTERVPSTGPTLFAINHPNALVDPALVLCSAPRPVSFLGKEPLFRMPVIGWLARAMDSIPVHRRHDAGSDPTKNRETFAKARSLLERGGTLAIAPEGVSHSEPRLRPIKTGAARIALGAGTALPVAIVPVGLFYTAKAVFRSSALVVFGQPLMVEPTPLGPDGEPPSAAVERVTTALKEALSTLVLEADDVEAHALVARTERLLTAALPDPRARSLDDIRTVRQRLLAGYRKLREGEPELLAKLTRRVDRLERAFDEANLDPAAVRHERIAAGAVLRAVGWLILRIVVFLPLALPGVVLHYPAYRLIGALVPRFVKETDALATAKILGAAIFYPLTWLGVGWWVGSNAGWKVGVAAPMVAPLAGYAALKLVERFDRFLSGTRALGLYLFAPEHFQRLAAERDALRAEILAIAARIEP